VTVCTQPVSPFRLVSHSCDKTGRSLTARCHTSDTAMAVIRPSPIRAPTFQGALRIGREEGARGQPAGGLGPLAEAGAQVLSSDDLGLSFSPQASRFGSRVALSVPLVGELPDSISLSTRASLAWTSRPSYRSARDIWPYWLVGECSASGRRSLERSSGSSARSRREHELRHDRSSGTPAPHQRDEAPGPGPWQASTCSTASRGRPPGGVISMHLGAGRRSPVRRSVRASASGVVLLDTRR